MYTNYHNHSFRSIQPYPLTMDLNEAVSLNGGLCTWSPNGRYLALVASRTRLIIRDSSDLQVLRSEVVIFTASQNSQSSDGTINKMQFSPDSEFILVANFKLGLTQIFRVLHSDWKAKITEGPSGLVDIDFCPDSKHLISFADFNVKLTIWSLVDKRTRYIKFPKSKECVKFSKNGKFLAVVERRDGRDYVTLFTCEDWNVYHHFEVDFLNTAKGCGGVCWSPTSTEICLYSDHLEYECHVYSIPSGQRLMVYKADKSSFGIGIRKVVWSPCGKVLGVGGGDSKLRLFNSLNWSLIAELQISHQFTKQDKTHIYEEKEISIQDVDIDIKIAKEWTSKRIDTQYVSIDKRPVQLAQTKSSKSVVELYGIKDIKFSPNGLYMAIINDSMSTSVYIFDVINLRVDTVLAHRYPVIKCEWGPGKDKSQLMILTQDDGILHAYTPHGVACLGLPTINKDYEAHEIVWNPKGKAIALVGKTSVVCCRIGSDSK